MLRRRNSLEAQPSDLCCETPGQTPDQSPTSSRMISSPVSAPRPKVSPRLLFSPSADDENSRRRSAPVTGLSHTPVMGGRYRKRCGDLEERRNSAKKSRVRQGNINPFTPAPYIISSEVKKARDEAKRRRDQDRL